MNTCRLQDFPSHPRSSRTTLTRAMPGRKKPQTILVIEQDHALRATLCEWLRDAGFEAIGEHTGRSGLSRILLREHTTQPINGVLLSMKLEPCESRLVLSELRDTYPSMPVVVMAAAKQRVLIEDALRLGAMGHLRAPFDRNVFKRKCSAFFRDPDQSD